MRKALPVAALALLAAACAPNYSLPPTPLPDAVTPGEQVVVPKDWWKSFNDPALDRLVDSAFAASPTLALAVAKRRRARESRDRSSCRPSTPAPPQRGSACRGRPIPRQAAISRCIRRA
jgi:outer membrane protein TolC